VTTVLLGTNRFTGFSVLLGMPDRPVLRVGEDAAVYLDTRDLPTTLRFYVISDASQAPDSPVRVVRAGDKTSCGLFLGAHALVLATVVQPSLVHVRLDLRPLGLVIYDDIDGLHVGGTRIAAQNLQGSGTAIWLA
jgi:hypothetical protein